MSGGYGEFWTMDPAMLGTGLNVASGQLLLRGWTPLAARREFNRLVGGLGLERARGVADAAFRAGGNAAALDALYRELGEAPPATPGHEEPPLQEALGFMPGEAVLSIDYPTALNGGTPWKDRPGMTRGRIVSAIDRAWRAAVPPDAGRAAKAAYGEALARALAEAMRSDRPERILPGRGLHPAFRPAGESRWWSHDGLRRLVADLEDGRVPEAFGMRGFAAGILRAHLAEGRMPADVADRAIALVHGGPEPAMRPDPADLGRAAAALGETEEAEAWA